MKANRSYGKMTDYSRLSKSASFVTSQTDEQSDSEKTLKFETFVAQCRKNAPTFTKHPKSRQIKTEYVTRSRTIGREALENPFLFDDYFRIFEDKDSDDLPEVREIKIYHNFEKILGIQCFYDVGKEKSKGPIYIGTDADLGYEEATLTLEKGDTVVEISGWADRCIHRLRIRTFFGQVIEAGGHAGKYFKPLFKPNYKLLAFGGSATEQLDTLYCYF